MTRARYTSEPAIELSPEEAERHGVGILQTHGFPGTQDRRVLNLPENGYLAGAVIQVHRSDTMQGSKRYFQVLPAERLMANVSAVEQSIEDELRSLEGVHTPTGERKPGILELMEEDTHALTNWLDLSVDERLDIGRHFGWLANKHALARNDHNAIMGSQAAAMAPISNNPMAMKLKLPLIRREAVDRHQDLGETRKGAASRRVLYGQWLVHENRYLAQAYQVVNRMIDHQIDEASELDRSVREIWFNFQPFNAFAAQIEQTGRKIEDVAVLEGLARGIHFVRFKPYLEQPFRKLTSTRTKLDALSIDDRDDLQAALTERKAALEEMPLTGPYKHLAGRILQRMDETQIALTKDKSDVIKHKSEEAKALISRHALSSQDAVVEDWYGHTLVGVRI